MCAKKFFFSPLAETLRNGIVSLIIIIIIINRTREESRFGSGTNYKFLFFSRLSGPALWPPEFLFKRNRGFSVGVNLNAA